MDHDINNQVGEETIPNEVNYFTSVNNTVYRPSLSSSRNENLPSPTINGDNLAVQYPGTQFNQKDPIPSSGILNAQIPDDDALRALPSFAFRDTGKIEIPPTKHVSDLNSKYSIPTSLEQQTSNLEAKSILLQDSPMKPSATDYSTSKLIAEIAAKYSVPKTLDQYNPILEPRPSAEPLGQPLESRPSYEPLSRKSIDPAKPIAEPRRSLEPIKKPEAIPDYIPSLSSYDFVRPFNNPFDIRTSLGKAETTNKTADIPQRSKDNPMFYSQAIERRYSLPVGMSSSGSFDRDNSSVPLRGDKKDNPLFYSTVQPLAPAEQAKKNKELDIFSEIKLPRSALKVLEDQDNQLREMEHYITQEKYKVSIDMDNILEEIAELLNRRKNTLNRKLDSFYLEYKQNYDILKEKVVAYKGNVKDFFHKQEDKEKFLNPNQVFNPLLKSIQFYKIVPDTPNSRGNFVKFREDPCSVEGNAAAINREADKRLIGLMAEEILNQGTQKPLYNHSEPLQRSYAELKQELVSKVKEILGRHNNEDSMVYTPTLERFSTYFAFPKIDSMLADDNLGVIGDSEKLVNMSPKLEKQVPVEPNNRALCIRAIPVDYVAIGCADGSVKIFNYTSNSITTTIKAHQGMVTTIDIMKVQVPDLNELVLLTGSNDSSLRVWQISQQKCVRLLKGHKGTITSTIPIKDGVTLLSSAEDGNIMIWNMSSGKLFNKLNQHTKVINAMHLFKDGTKFVSVSDDKTICIWKVIYGYSNEFLRRTFSSCEPEKVYEDCCEVTAVNSSADDFNLLITGGTDQKIKIWNTEENMCIKQVNCHTFGLSSILFFENPFKLATYERYIILTSGFGENSIKLSRSKSDYSENLILNAYADTQKDIPANFRVQLVKSKVTESLKLVTLSQTYGQGISIWALEQSIQSF